MCHRVSKSAVMVVADGATDKLRPHILGGHLSFGSGVGLNLKLSGLDWENQCILNAQSEIGFFPAGEESLYLLRHARTLPNSKCAGPLEPSRPPSSPAPPSSPSYPAIPRAFAELSRF
jgi:hypothetical protein